MSKRSIEEEDTVAMGVNNENDETKKRRGAIPSTIADVLGDLKGLKFPGSPSFGGKADDVPTMTGLTVNGFGLLALPLISGDVVAKLAAVATKSPFGKGSDTIVDESVRKSWQFEPDQLSFENPLFQEAIQTLANRAARGLGVPENVSVDAILYKALLYEPGGFFKKHRDTEKEDGMFATLVVQLPSIYTGGNLKVLHGGGEDDVASTKVYDMGTDDGTAPYCCHFLAHYADAVHEVEAVETGYRFALVYSLCHKQKGSGTESPQQVPTMEAATRNAKKLLSTLERLPPQKKLMFFPLSHCYTNVSIARYGLQALKGRDSVVLRAFKMNGGTWKFRIFCLSRTYSEEDGDFLDDFDGSEENHRRIHMSECKSGNATFEEVYWTEGTDDRLSDKWLSSADVYDSCDDGGRVLASPVDIADTWKQTEQLESEYTGNDGYRLRETNYQCYTLMVYTEDAELDLVMEYDISTAIDMVSNGRGKDQANVDRLFHVLQSLPSRVAPWPSYRDGTRDAEKALALLEEPTEGELLDEGWVKKFTSCLNLIVFEEVENIGTFWTNFGNLVAKCSKAKNVTLLCNHILPLLGKPIKKLTEATAKAFLIALVSTNAPNIATKTMVQTLEGAIDPETIDVSNKRQVSEVLRSMMELQISPSIHPLVRKLVPLWKNGNPNTRNVCQLISYLKPKMDADTTNQWVDEILPAVIDEFFGRYDPRNYPAIAHMVFERGTDKHVEKVGTIADEKVRLRWQLVMLFQAYDGPTLSQAWKPLVERHVGGATKEVVERFLEPNKWLYSGTDGELTDLVHFLFANGTDEDVIKLLEIVDSKKHRADVVRKWLLKLYKSYEGSIMGKHAWDVVIERLQKLNE